MKPVLALALAVVSCQADPDAGTVARDAIARYGCPACHAVPGKGGTGGWTGPPLTHMARQAYVAGLLPVTPETVAAFIRDPQAIDPRSAMPALGVTGPEAEAIARYLLAEGRER